MHHIYPDKYKTIWLVSMCYIISKQTYFLLKVNLHCNLVHFLYQKFATKKSSFEPYIPKFNKNGIFTYIILQKKGHSSPKSLIFYTNLVGDVGDTWNFCALG